MLRLLCNRCAAAGWVYEVEAIAEERAWAEGVTAGARARVPSVPVMETDMPGNAAGAC